MKQELLDAYKKAVQLHFEKEKSGLYSSHLIHPSRAKLRQLCVERFKGTTNPEDLNTFRIFFGFEFEEGNLNKLKSQTDKFRPIENFLKKETDTNDLEGINLAAILVDFNPRPFLKFAKNYRGDEVSEKAPLSDKPFNGNEDDNKIIDENTGTEENPTANNFVKSYSTKQKVFFGLGVAAIVLISGFALKTITGKECIQWSDNHFEKVACQGSKIGFANINPVYEFDENLLNFKKIDVCDTTKFFVGEEPIVWYLKKNNKCEFFNSPGIHPIWKKPLRPVTNYIVQKYVLKD